MTERGKWADWRKAGRDRRQTAERRLNFPERPMARRSKARRPKANRRYSTQVERDQRVTAAGQIGSPKPIRKRAAPIRTRVESGLVGSEKGVGNRGGRFRNTETTASDHSAPAIHHRVGSRFRRRRDRYLRGSPREITSRGEEFRGERGEQQEARVARECLLHLPADGADDTGPCARDEAAWPE